MRMRLAGRSPSGPRAVVQLAHLRKPRSRLPHFPLRPVPEVDGSVGAPDQARVGQRSARFWWAVAPRHPDAPALCDSMDVAFFPPALAAEGLEPMVLDVHRHRVAAVVIRPAERQWQQVVDLEGTVDRFLAVRANSWHRAHWGTQIVRNYVWLASFWYRESDALPPAVRETRTGGAATEQSASRRRHVPRQLDLHYGSRVRTSSWKPIAFNAASIRSRREL